MQTRQQRAARRHVAAPAPRKKAPVVAAESVPPPRRARAGWSRLTFTQQLTLALGARLQQQVSR